MGSGKLSFAIIWVLSFGVFFLSGHFIFGKELRRQVVCYSDALHIDCGDPDSFIAVHEALFSTEEPPENHTCPPQTPQHAEYVEDESGNATACREDIRISVNKACSGSPNCTYSYFEETDRHCHVRGGQFIVKYDCVPERSVNKFCNTKVQAREGYISSPGFPRYYPRLEGCSWSVEGSAGQTILLRILHLHTTRATEVYPTVSDPDAYAPGILGLLMSGEETSRCLVDALVVSEGPAKRAVVCGEELQTLRTVVAEADSGLTLRFQTAAFLPASGFLAYFKVQGCPTMQASDGSYLVERNGSAAVYACGRHQVFNDTLENFRFLSCVRDHHWNDTLPPCIALEEATTLLVPHRIIESEELDNSTTIAAMETTTMSTFVVAEKASYLEDILIPGILIAVLILGNAVIVTIICYMRKKQDKSTDGDNGEGEELNQPKPQPLVSDEVKDV